MTADVYAADDDLAPGVGNRLSEERFIVKVVADADADLLLRVAAQLASLNAAPRRFTFERAANDIATVEIVIAGCSSRAVDLVCRKLKQLTSVIECEWAPYQAVRSSSINRP